MLEPYGFLVCTTHTYLAQEDKCFDPHKKNVLQSCTQQAKAKHGKSLQHKFNFKTMKYKYLFLLHVPTLISRQQS
jgi:hypothetical protein